MGRSAGKPTSDQRYAPFFAAGWNGDLRSPFACMDCGMPTYVSVSPSRPDAAQVAHVDPTDQRWWLLRDGWTNVTATCRSCNVSHGDQPIGGMVPVPAITSDHVRASVGWFAANRDRDAVEVERRAAARSAARAARNG